eukprot:3682788-Pleurochrysis_carterae.AAC.2
MHSRPEARVQLPWHFFCLSPYSVLVLHFRRTSQALASGKTPLACEFLSRDSRQASTTTLTTLGRWTPSRARRRSPRSGG